MTKTYNVDLTGLNTAGFEQMPNVLLSYDLAHPPVGKAVIIDDHTVEVEFMEETALMQEMEMQMVCLVQQVNDINVLLALALEPKLKEQNG